MKPDKSITLIGTFCSLIPIEKKDLPSIVELRNKERNKYYLNQKCDITIELQEEWYQKYLNRDNDIYWGIWSKANILVGTIRLYNIENNVCEEGSCIINERYTKEAPYAVEAKYLLMKYAFQTLGMHHMINETKIDNKVMNSLAQQQGFRFVKYVDIGGEKFNYMILDADQFREEKVKKILEYWKERG